MEDLKKNSSNIHNKSDIQELFINFESKITNQIKKDFNENLSSQLDNVEKLIIDKIENFINEKFSHKLLSRLSNLIDDKLKNLNDKFYQLSNIFDRLSKK